MADASPIRLGPEEQAGVAEAERLVREAEFGARELAGWSFWLAGGIALAMTAFQLWTAAVGTLPGVLQRSIHLTFAMVLCFLFYPISKRARQATLPWYDLILGGLGAYAALYITLNHEALIRRVGIPEPMDTLMGLVLVLLILEGTRRAVGLWLPAITAVFLLYAFLGPWMPELFSHRGYSLRRVIGHLYLTTEGIFGIPVGVSSTFVFAFVLFGAILERTGAGEYLIRVAFSLFGGTRGGPAKVAVVASAFMGTITGSSIANTATIGSMTIPLMKRVGFKPEVAGGIETAAGGNGQLMPPVMGAAAFVMSEWLRIPYLEIAKAAALPAIIDQLALLGAVHLLALKHGIKGLPREELPRFLPTFLSGLHYLIPVGVLLYYLIAREMTPLTSAFMAIVAAMGMFVLSSLIQGIRKGPIVPGHEPAAGVGPAMAEAGLRLVAALYMGARNMASVAVTCAGAGIIVGIVTLTGVGLNLSGIVVDLSAGNLYLGLFLTMVACLILGMGVPTTPTYIIMATLTAPALIAVGRENGLEIPIIAVHLFVFYFGILADDTPPVGLAAYAAAGIARSDPIKTGWRAFSLDMRTFLLPYMFITAPQMLLINTTWIEALHIFVSASIGMYALAGAMQGYLITEARWHERVILFVSAIALVKPGLYSDIGGIIGLALVYALQRARAKDAPLF
ncbi:MAG: TRAP transporter, 4TM/12TM fusion protein [Candidatus Rokubacteria bacterium CSP1-6]|nr:MAG: TRAP transporter, 4TM/12TM fusion protein [Candidatus Rokubacteria bacterium CSP1-6]